MKGQKILKITSILMIIGSVISAIAGVIVILGISALAALSGSAEDVGLLYASSIIVVVASVIQFIAGIGACSAPGKAASCIKWGIIIVILTIISIIIGVVGGGEFSITSLILNLLLPGAYVYGAMQMKGNI